MKKAVIILICVSLFGRCSNNNVKINNQNNNLKSFYYPYSSKKKVYIYEFKMDDYKTTNYDLIWFDTLQNDTILNREIYDSDFKKFEFQKQLVNNFGVFLVNRVFYQNINDSMNTKIYSDTIILWNEYFKNYNLIYEDGAQKIKSTRLFKETDSAEIDNIKYQTIKFVDNLEITKFNTTIKGKREIQFCESIGYFGYITKYENGKIAEVRLIDIVDYDIWTATFH